ncbi:hypothetical protein MWU38_01315 [Qipengyuania sp. S6317L1]|uniref:hypothetical protein n=1 Tax=Qipengyuania sp. S6317L1 TaxID=2926410 RepID=UPI001FF6DC9D|nr:hypothetical protein [Qipengyuania sp. S6317L1]MCK0098008.1 hypothetical protein [Qipengyuania sp. S6317L1]
MAADVPSCRVENANAAKLSMSSSQMCQCFQRRLADEVGSDIDLSAIRIVLKPRNSHEVEASVHAASETSAPVLEPVSVKVFDRSINASDIESLASAVGRALLDPKP